MSNGETSTDDEQMKASRLNDILEEFLSADKYALVASMWNLPFPPVVKAYTDATSAAGRAFKYSAEGPQGLLTDKKVLHTQSRGGHYTEGPAANFEMGNRYLGTIVTLLGMLSYEIIIIEGHNTEPHKAEGIRVTSINNVEKLATIF